MGTQKITLSIDEGLATLTLNRPEVHNAVDLETMEQWERHLKTIDGSDARVVILTGAGGESFSSGGDLKYFAGFLEEKHVLAMSHRMQRLLDHLYHGPRVVIGMVQGNSYGGGCEILTACHFRFGSDDGVYSFRQAANGITTGWGGGMRLFRMLGRSPALRLFLTSDNVPAAEMLRLGFLDQTYPAAFLQEEVHQFARKIIANDPGAVAGFLELARHFVTDDRDTFRERETHVFSECWTNGPFKDKLKRFS